MLLVVPPALALKLARRQVLLERARLVVEAEEQGLSARVQGYIRGTVARSQA